MLNKVRRIMRGAAAGLLVLAFAGAAMGEERRLPVPAVTIRSGDVIKEEMIMERAFAPNLLGPSLSRRARACSDAWRGVRFCPASRYR